MKRRSFIKKSVVNSANVLILTGLVTTAGQAWATYTGTCTKKTGGSTLACNQGAGGVWTCLADCGDADSGTGVATCDQYYGGGETGTITDCALA